MTPTNYLSANVAVVGLHPAPVKQLSTVVTVTGTLDPALPTAVEAAHITTATRGVSGACAQSPSSARRRTTNSLSSSSIASSIGGVS
jgi:hypothetical protein